MSDRSPRFPTPTLLAAALLLPGFWTAPGELQAQDAVVAEEENFRAEPNGTVVGRLEPGTRLVVVERDGSWARATLEGFVWTASMQVRDGGDFDLVISEPEGENIRDEPSGRIAGRLASGALLEEIERIPGWIRVRRTGWIWTPSLEIDEAGTDAAAEPVSAAPEAAGAAAGGRQVTEEGETWIRIGPREVEVRAEPDGDQVAQAWPDADVRVISEEGNWVRVRLEGWVWGPDLELAPGEAPEGAVLRDVHPADLAEAPERFRGRLVEMVLQFISLEAAEQIRTDFYQGEPFLLTRSLEGDRTFVYVAVPPERREEMETLIPLETIRVLARVRSTAAAFTGNPILDLMEVERER